MILITLNSDKRSSGYSYDFSTNFNPNLQIPENTEIALSSIQMWNSLPNISVSRANNQWRYFNGSTWSATQTIPNGNYSIDDLNLYIQATITTLGGLGTNIILLPNYNTLKCDIVLKNSYQLDLSIGNLYLLLGWTKAIVNTSGTGTNLVDISNGITTYYVHCNLVDSGTSISDGSTSDVIYSFTPDKPAGNLLNKEPLNLIYTKCNTRYISRISIRLSDQNGNTLSDLSDENISITLVLKN
jgi:hypothetical protein